MYVPEGVKALLVAGPIVLLLAMGFWLTLRSGVASLGSVQGLRRLAVNLSETVLIVAVGVMGLLVIQGIIGYRLSLSW